MEIPEITAEINLKRIIAESREVAQALNEFADNLERIEKKYTDPQESDEKRDVILARPKCTFCEHAALMAQQHPCNSCYFTDNRPNFEPNEKCLEQYEKIKEGMNKNE